MKRHINASFLLSHHPGLRMWLTSALVIVFGLSVSQNECAADEAYKIVLTRPEHVGEVFELTSSSSIKRTHVWREPGAPAIDPEQFDGELRAKETVLAIEPISQNACKAQFEIISLKRNQEQLLEAGSVVVGENPDGLVRFSVGGHAVDPKVQDLLESLIGGMHAANDPHAHDDVLRVAQPQKVGSSWAINAAAAALAYSNPAIKVDEKDISGTVTLVAANLSGKGTLLHFARKIEVRNLHGDWLDRRKYNSGTSVDECEWDCPADPLVPFGVRLSSKTKATFEVSIRADNNAAHLMSVTVERTLKMASEPVEAAATRPG